MMFSILTALLYAVSIENIFVILIFLVIESILVFFYHSFHIR